MSDASRETNRARPAGRTLFAVILATLVAALGIAACGGDEESDGDATTTVEETGSDRELVIEAQRGAFDAQAVYDATAASVVTIRSIFPAGSNPLGGAGPQAGQGSGFVISDEGEIVTNAHVVTDGQAQGTADVNPAREVFVQFADRSTVEAEIVGFDPFGDVALIKVDPDGLDLDPIELGDLDDVAVGDPVAAIGSPFGERQSLSVGVVSATDRSIPSLTDFQIDGALQTDASINPGNSGGPLLDAEARVIGINQQIDTTSGGNQGVGFAVPIDLATRSIEQLREDGDVDYAYIGVETNALYPQLAERIGVDVGSGALIASVTPGGPADDAGIQAGDQEITFQGLPFTIGGDVIVAVEGEEILAETDLPRIISRQDPNAEITVELIRDGEHEEITVQLEERPDDVPTRG
jgi:S1-C subfamily serine protease